MPSCPWVSKVLVLSDVDASKVDLLVNLVTLGSKSKPQTTFCCCAGLVEPCIGLEECRRLAETLAIDHQELDLFLGRTAEPIFFWQRMGRELMKCEFIPA